MSRIYSLRRRTINNAVNINQNLRNYLRPVGED